MMIKKDDTDLRQLSDIERDFREKLLSGQEYPGKKQECEGCIGLTDEHTCEGWDEFQRMKAGKGKCHTCAKLRDEIELVQSRVREAFFAQLVHHLRSQ